MDFNKYYNSQANGEISGYSGPRFQRGYGFGSIFKKFFRWVIPIIKDKSQPIIKGTLDSLNEGISNFQNDLDKDKGIKESAQERIKETFQKIKNKIQTGGKKRRIKRIKQKFVNKNRKRVKHKSIFD